MTNAEIENIYKTALGDGRIAALRAVWNAGWYEASAITPSAQSADKSLGVGRHVAVVTGKKR